MLYSAYFLSLTDYQSRDDHKKRAKQNQKKKKKFFNLKMAKQPFNNSVRASKKKVDGKRIL